MLHSVAFEVQIRRAVCMFGFQRITSPLYILIGACWLTHFPVILIVKRSELIAGSKLLFTEK